MLERNACRKKVCLRFIRREWPWLWGFSPESRTPRIVGSVVHSIMLTPYHGIIFLAMRVNSAPDQTNSNTSQAWHSPMFSDYIGKTDNRWRSYHDVDSHLVFWFSSRMTRGGVNDMHEKNKTHQFDRLRSILCLIEKIMCWSNSLFWWARLCKQPIRLERDSTKTKDWRQTQTTVVIEKGEK